MDRPTCETCVYWNGEGGDIGQCRRHAPGSDAQETDWQVKSEDQWCGDHHLFPAYLASLSSGEAAHETEPTPVATLKGVPDELYMLWVHGSDKEDGHWALPIDTTRGSGDLCLAATDYETARVAAKEQMEKYPNLGTIFAVKVL